MRVMKSLPKLALMACLTGSAAAQSNGGDGAAGMRVERDIGFAVVDESELALDLYLPDGVEDPPLIIWVHGGAWRFGSKDSVGAVDLVRHGFAIASVSHRLSSVAAFPAQVHDLKAAVRFLRANSERLGFDGSRIAISGASSGAHLAALVAVTNGSTAHEGTLGDFTRTSSDVQALVSYFGASNLLTILDQSTPFGLSVRVPALELLLGGPLEEREDLARLASPVHYVDAGDPPMYLLHGDQDPQMPISQTHELHGAARKAGIDVVFDVVHGARHGGEAFYTPERIAAVAAFLRTALNP